MLTVFGAAGVTGVAGCSELPVNGNRREYYVAPDGSDRWNSGAEDSPLETIGKSLQEAQPGDTIHLAPGEYREAVRTVQDGEPDNPITIIGPPEAVVRPPKGGNACLNISHSHVHVTGITLNGLIDPARKFETKEAWANWCVRISPIPRYDDGVDYLHGIVLEPSQMGNSGRAMIELDRLRDSSIGSFRMIGPSGMWYDDRIPDRRNGHVREVIYVGTPEKRRFADWYPYDTIDRTRNLRIHHIDNSAGYRHNELVDIKLGTTKVLVEYCTTRNPRYHPEGRLSATFNVNGNDCVVRWNDVRNVPLPFTFGAWAPSDDIDAGNWAQNNSVYGNVLRGFLTGPFQMRDKPNIGPASFEEQRILCGNDIERGSPDITAWTGTPNGFDGSVDKRGQDQVTVTVGAGPDNRSFDPAVVFVSPGTEITWEWSDGDHYFVREGRFINSPDTIPDPPATPYSESKTLNEVGMHTFVCTEHNEEGAFGQVIVQAGEDEYALARVDCGGEVPESQGIGYTGGDSPWA